MRGVQPIRGGAMQGGYEPSSNSSNNLGAVGGIEEVVNVPGNLSDFASDPKFQQILLKVKVQTSINFVDLKRDAGTSKVVGIVINAPTSETAGNARRLVETHFKNQIKIMSAEAKLAKTQTELFSAQGEVASGMMVDFFVPISVIGLVIGKSGARIKQIEKETGVSSINVDGHTGKIMVVGPDAQSVQSAREHLELQEDFLPLNSSQAEWLSNDRFNGSLSDIRNDNNLSSARVDRDGTQLAVVGTVPAIRSLRAMLPVQLEYIDKAIEIESTERHAREQLRDFKREHGMRGPGDDRRGYQGRGPGDDRRSYQGRGPGDDRRAYQGRGPSDPGSSRGAPTSYGGSPRGGDRNPAPAPSASTSKGGPSANAKGGKKMEQIITVTMPPKAPEAANSKVKQTKASAPAPAAAHVPAKKDKEEGKGKAAKGKKEEGADKQVSQLADKVAAVKVKEDPTAAGGGKKAAGKKDKEDKKVEDKIPAPEGAASVGPEDSKRRRGNNKKEKKEAGATAAEEEAKVDGAKEKAKSKPKKNKSKDGDDTASAAVGAAAPGGEKEKGDEEPKEKGKGKGKKRPGKKGGEKSADPTPESTTDPTTPAAAGEDSKAKKEEKAGDKKPKTKTNNNKSKSKGKKEEKEKEGDKDKSASGDVKKEGAAPAPAAAAKKEKEGKGADKADGGVLDLAPLGKRDKKERSTSSKDKIESPAAPEVTAEA